MLEGVYVANVTPFRPGSLGVDHSAYLHHVDWLAAAGVDGVVPFGTNGEGPSATPEEKQRVLGSLVGRNPGLSLLPTVAEGNLPHTVQMLRFLNDLDVEAVLVLPPYYFKPAAAEGLRRFYDTVLETSRHPVVVYHIPKYAVPVPVELVTDLDVWGVKDSGGEADYAAAVSAGARRVLLGTEDDYPGRLPGASAVVSALANVVPDLVLQAYAGVRAGDADRAVELSARLRTIRAATKEHASPAVLKALAGARHGAAMGTVRPPLVSLPDDYDAAATLRRLDIDG